ncbi:MAG TPA: PHB depolymerase family esterase [Burkholderiaceae bacterium]|jgi:poly(hydroxyalkanoate) depolymerase family esterase|nr:PHB depolymerase family esterase [Burkholderiaceae bacterium]
MKFNKDFLAQIREATQILRTSGPSAATAAIQRALRRAANDGEQPERGTALPPSTEELIDINPAPGEASGTSPVRSADVLARFRHAAWPRREGAATDQPVEDAEIIDIDEARGGKFLSASCRNQAGARDYKIYVPRAYRGQALPLVVMLHGCKQSPDDFAAGTDMNALAEEHGWFVAYPAQIYVANGSNCWNWFKTGDQQRDGGEPSIIADITREITRAYRIDPQRVYVAGLSAGGAMAAIMGAVYPELYAAVGVHSGLPHGAAHDLPSALAAMKSGIRTSGPRHAQASASASQRQSTPIIVFHGDRDSTVHPRNGDQVLTQYMADDADNAASGANELRVTVEKGAVPQGHAYTRTIRCDQSGKAIAEHWVVHGAGHAWSGGTRYGSYTDPKGPDASREMLRFFQTHRRAAHL